MKRAVSLMMVVGLLVAFAGCCCWVPGRGRGHRGPDGGYGRHGGPEAPRGGGFEGGGLERQ